MTGAGPHRPWPRARHPDQRRRPAAGRSFRDVREFKRLLLEDERQLARNLTRQLVVYATGAPVRFGDRAEIERILDRIGPGGHGVRSTVHEIVQSSLFLNK